MPHQANNKYSTGTACATHKKCSNVASGMSQATPKDPTVNTTNPTTPHNARLGKAVTSIVVGRGASDSEAVEGCGIKAVLLGQ
jgi:hypothetical protein